MPEAWKGIIPPLTTPFSADGRVSIRRLERNLERYQKLPLSGFLLLGSTGEAIHLGEREKLEVVRTASKLISDDRRLLVGVSAHSLSQAKEFLDELSNFAIDAVLLSTPHYYRNHLTVSGWAEFFTAVADYSPFPVLLYNFPQCTGVELPPDLVGRLASHPGIAGIKDSSGNLIYLQKLLAATGSADFQVIGGSAEVMLPTWRLGVRAGIYAVACVLPELVLQVGEAWLAEGAEADVVQAQLFEASATIVAGLGISGIKYAMDCRDYEGGLSRVPLMPLSESDRQRVEEVLRLVTQPAAAV